MTYQSSWEKEFDEKIFGEWLLGTTLDGDNTTPDANAIKSFIQSVLQAREEWLVKSFIEIIQKENSKYTEFKAGSLAKVACRNILDEIKPLIHSGK